MLWEHSNYTRGHDESESNGNSMSSITFTSQSLSQHFPQPRRAIKLDSLPPSLSRESSQSSEESSSPSHLQAHHIEKEYDESNSCYKYDYGHHQEYDNNNIVSSNVPRQELQQQEEEHQQRVPFRVRDFNVNIDGNLYTRKKATEINLRCDVVNDDVQQTHNVHHHHHHHHHRNSEDDRETSIIHKSIFNSRNALDSDSLIETKEVNVHTMKDRVKLNNTLEGKERTSWNIVDDDKYASTYTRAKNTAINRELGKHKLSERDKIDEKESCTLRFPFTRALSLTSSPSPTPLHVSLESSTKRTKEYKSSLSRESLSENEEVYEHVEDRNDINNINDINSKVIDENSTNDNVYEYSSNDASVSNCNYNNNNFKNVYRIDDNKCMISRSTSPPPRITGMESITITSTSINTRGRYSCTLSEGMYSVSANEVKHMNKDDDDDDDFDSDDDNDVGSKGYEHFDTYTNKEENIFSSTNIDLSRTQKIDEDDVISTADNNIPHKNYSDKEKKSHKDQHEYSGVRHTISVNTYGNESATPPPRRAFVLSSHDISLEMSNSHVESQRETNNVDNKEKICHYDQDDENAKNDNDEQNTHENVSTTVGTSIVDKDSGNKNNKERAEEKLAQITDDDYNKNALENVKRNNENNVLTIQSSQTEIETSLVIECATYSPSESKVVDEHIKEQHEKICEENRISCATTQEMNMNNIYSDIVDETLRQSKCVEETTCIPSHINDVSTNTNVTDTSVMLPHERHVSSSPQLTLPPQLQLLLPEASPLSLSESLMLVNGGTPTPLRAWRENFIKEERNIMGDKTSVQCSAPHECENDNANNTCTLCSEDNACAECMKGNYGCLYNTNTRETSHKSFHYLSSKDEFNEDKNVIERSSMYKSEKAPLRSVSLVSTRNKLFSDEQIEATTKTAITKKNDATLYSSKINNHENLISITSNSIGNNKKKTENVNSIEIKEAQEYNGEKVLNGVNLPQHSSFSINEPRVSVEVRELVERAEEKIRRSRQSLLFTMHRLKNSHLQQEENLRNVQASLQEEKSELSEQWKHMEPLEEQHKSKRVKCESLHVVENNVNTDKAPSTSAQEEKDAAGAVILQFSDVITISDINSCKEVWNINVLDNRVCNIISSGNAQHWTVEELQKELAENANTILNEFILIDKAKCGVLPMEIILHVIYITLCHDKQNKTKNGSQVQTHTSKKNDTSQQDNNELSNYTWAIYSTHESTYENKTTLQNDYWQCNETEKTQSQFSSPSNMHQSMKYEENELKSQLPTYKRTRCESNMRESPTRTLEKVMNAQANMKTRQTLEELYRCILEVFKCAFGECYALAHLGASNCSSFEVLEYVNNSTNTTIATSKQSILSDTCEKQINTNASDYTKSNELSVKLLSTFPRLTQPYALSHIEQQTSDNIDHFNNNLSASFTPFSYEYESKRRQSDYATSAVHENSLHKIGPDKFP